MLLLQGLKLVGAQAPVVPAAGKSSSSCMLLSMLLIQLIEAQAHVVVLAAGLHNTRKAIGVRTPLSCCCWHEKQKEYELL